MKLTFRIYPAVFTLYPNQEANLVSCKKIRSHKINTDSRESNLKKEQSWQYEGKCPVRAEGNWITLFVQPHNKKNASLKLPETCFSKPGLVQYAGDKYTLTYINVNN